MPLRSPKMYSFIFGFQRRVWWPKWTPASSNSFIVISTPNVPPFPNGCLLVPSILFAGSLPAVNYQWPVTGAWRPVQTGCPDTCPLAPETCSLPLRVLEALAGALLAVLLALFHARVPRQKTVLAQRRAQVRVEPCQGARHAHPHRVSLSAGAAATG